MQYNSPETVGWLLVFVLLAAAVIFTAEIIRDNIRRSNQRKEEYKALRAYRLKTELETRELFNTVEEAQNDFR